MLAFISEAQAFHDTLSSTLHGPRLVDRQDRDGNGNLSRFDRGLDHDVDFYGYFLLPQQLSNNLSNNRTVYEVIQMPNILQG